MPQPLPNKYAAQVSIGRAVSERPEQALNAANAIAHWATLDAMMPVIYNGLIQGDPKAASSAFAAIRNFKTRQDTIRGQAALTLKSERDRDCLDAILKLYDSTAKSRDKVAHHLWGTHSEIRDAIILIDPACMRTFSTNIQAHKANDDFTVQDGEKYLYDLRTSMVVWKSQDFADVADRCRRGLILATIFSIMTSKVGPHAPDDQARQMLLAQPEISEFLAHRESRRQKSGT